MTMVRGCGFTGEEEACQNKVYEQKESDRREESESCGFRQEKEECYYI